MLCDCSTWVCDEVRKLEAELDALRKDVESLRGSCKALGSENKHLKRENKRQSRAIAAAAVTALPATDALVEALEDMLHASHVRPSCQDGIVDRCRCVTCTDDRAREALATYRASQRKEG